MCFNVRFVYIKKRVEKLEDTVMVMALKVFNGFGEKINYLAQVIEELKKAVKREKIRRLTNRDVWIRSIAFSIGSGIFVGVVITLVKEVLPRLF